MVANRLGITAKAEQLPAAERAELTFGVFAAALDACFTPIRRCRFGGFIL